MAAVLQLIYRVQIYWAAVLGVQAHFNWWKFLINSNMQTTVQANKSPSLTQCLSLPRSVGSSFSVYATLLISMSVDGYPNAITDNYTPCCACVHALLCVCVHLCVRFSPLGSDALISCQLSCCPTASHIDNKQKDTETHTLTHTHTHTNLLYAHNVLRILVTVMATTVG